VLHHSNCVDHRWLVYEITAKKEEQRHLLNVERTTAIIQIVGSILSSDADNDVGIR